MENRSLIMEIEKRLPRKRFEHVLRVSETAKKMASLHGVPEDKAEQAAFSMILPNLWSRPKCEK